MEINAIELLYTAKSIMDIFWKTDYVSGFMELYKT
jgi:hypothetical protein